MDTGARHAKASWCHGDGHVPRKAAAEDAALRALQALIEPLAEALGPGNELALHDLRHLDCSLVAIAGDVTGRSPGAPATDLLLQHLQSGRVDDLIRYSVRTADGRQLCCSTIFLRDSDQLPYASICVNIDITEWLRVAGVLAAVVNTGGELSGQGALTSESFTPNVEDLAVAMVNRAIAEVGIPVELMRKEHRVDVVKRLDAAGLFLVQDSVGYVAVALSVSRFSVYKYLREVVGPEAMDVPRDRVRRATARQLPRPPAVSDRGLRDVVSS